MIFAIRRCVDNLGRIVLPKDMRRCFDFKSGDLLELIATDEGILIKKPRKKKMTRNEKEKSDASCVHRIFI